MLPLTVDFLMEGNFDQGLFENGFRFSSYGCLLPKYKPRRVSAVRHFPPGCGRNAPRIDPRPKDEAATLSRTSAVGDVMVSSPAKVDCQVVGVFTSPSRPETIEQVCGSFHLDNGVKVEELISESGISLWDFQPVRDPNDPIINAGPAEKASETEVEARSIDMRENSLLLETDELMSELLDKSLDSNDLVNEFKCEELNWDVGFPVQDFNPGCGQNALMIDLRREEGTGRADDNGEGGAVGILGTEVDRVGKSPDMPETDYLVEKMDQSDGLVNEIKAAGFNLEGELPEVERAKGLENGAIQVLSEKEHQILEESDELLRMGERVEEKTNTIKVSGFADRVAADVSYIESLTQSQCINDYILMEKKTSDVMVKYKRRRVSAVRDFPPFCGRTASRPPEADMLRIFENGKLPVKRKASTGNEALVKPESDQDRGVLTKKLKDSEETSQAGMVDAEGTGSVEHGSAKDTVTNETVPEPRKSLSITDEGNSYGLSSEVTMSELKRGSSDDEVSGLNLGGLEDIVIEQGKMAPPSFSQRQGKGATGSSGKSAIERKNMKSDLFRPRESNLTGTQECEANFSTAESGKKKSISAGKAKIGSKSVTSKNDEKRGVLSSKKHKHALVGQRTQYFDASSFPSHPASSSQGNARERVLHTLNFFRAICEKISKGEDLDLIEGEQSRTKQKVKRVDLEAVKIIKSTGKEVNTGQQIVGAVPGVEIGDAFQYRVELAIIGVHRLYQAGIDYMKQDGKVIAVSVVASGGYTDNTDDPDVLIYSGEGGTGTGKNKQPEDQKLERGNLALKNSISVGNPVRVIRGSMDTNVSATLGARAKVARSYFYDGLYTVDKYWTETGPHGKLVYMFELRRIPQQEKE